MIEYAVALMSADLPSLFFVFTARGMNALARLGYFPALSMVPW
jgi:hypothetical protein